MRKIAASSKVASRIRLSSCAEARSCPNGFSTMTRAPLVQPDRPSCSTTVLEQHGRDGEVVRRPLGGAEFLAEGLEGRRVLVVAVDVAQQAAELVEGRGDRAPPCFSRLSRARARSWSRFQPALATPMTGTSRWPRFTIAWSAGKIFL